jgi:hypothetical protein
MLDVLVLSGAADTAVGATRFKIHVPQFEHFAGKNIAKLGT